MDTKGTNLSVIGQGTMGIGGYFSADYSKDDVYVAAIKTGVAQGLTLIDTAEVYGAGHTEEVVGNAINGIRNKVFISTKFSPEHNCYSEVLKAVEGSLNRLKADYIDLYQVHWPNPGIPIEETMTALEKLYKEGKILNIGLSNFSLSEIIAAQRSISAKISFIQMEYNLFDRGIEKEILEYCKSHKINILAYSPLDQGNLCINEAKSKLLQKLSLKYEKTLSQIVLNWIISKEIIPIPKALDKKHIVENAEASCFSLSDGDLDKIDNVFKSEVVFLNPEEIRVVKNVRDLSNVYATIQEAMENRLNFTPTPQVLAESIKETQQIKPIRVEKASDGNESKYKHYLTEGRIRYWAWVLAFGFSKPIPCLIRGN